MCAELGSTFQVEHDLGCFEHVLTHSNRLVWFVLSETDVLKSRSDLPGGLTHACTIQSPDVRDASHNGVSAAMVPNDVVLQRF